MLKDKRKKPAQDELLVQDGRDERERGV